MKALMKGVISVVLSLTAIMSVISMGACQRVNTEGTSKELQIHIWESGFGSDFLYNLAEAYMDKNPETEIDIVADANQSAFYQTIEVGVDANEYDLYFDYGPKYRKYSTQGLLEDLSSVMDATVEGESKKISEKMFPEVIEGFRENNKYYSLPWQTNITGLVYKNSIFKEHSDWELPRTTDELIALAGKIKTAGYVPFIYNQYGYWDYLLEPWIAQYETMDGLREKFWQAGDPTGKTANQDGWDMQGRREAIEVLAALIQPDGYSVKDCYTWTHTKSQSAYLAGKGDQTAVITPNGDWLQNETIGNAVDFEKADLRFMDTPVLSSIVEAPDMLTGVNGNTKNLTETDLKQAIDVVDGVENAVKPNGISDYQFGRIQEARKMVFSTGFSLEAFVPSYAEGREEAKEFLKFMYSDEGMAIYYEALNIQLPLNYDDESKNPAADAEDLNGFMQSRNERAEGVVYLYNVLYNPIWYNTELIEQFYYVPETRLMGPNGANESVDTYLKNNRDYISDNWERLIVQAGLS